MRPPADNVGRSLALNMSILTLPISVLSQAPAADLSEPLVEKANADAWIYVSIPDEEFAGGNVPMTKSEVCPVNRSRLVLFQGPIRCHIGLGTDSLPEEKALADFLWPG